MTGAIAEVSTFEVAHVTFALRRSPDDGNSFALLAAQALSPKDRARPLFVGHIPRGMAADLRALADVIEPLEPQRGEQ
ncbi:hypothetical protein [Shimia sp.]|uniref:hypothetical protein n=1 Tax=Shimia sp. TaxID=1954381 RepID=UPI003B8D1600